MIPVHRLSHSKSLDVFKSIENPFSTQKSNAITVPLANINGYLKIVVGCNFWYKVPLAGKEVFKLHRKSAMKYKQ